MFLRHSALRFVTLSRHRIRAHYLPCHCFFLNSSYLNVDYQKSYVSSHKNIYFSGYSNKSRSVTGNISVVDYERITDDTLVTLTEYFEELIEATDHLQSPDVTYGDGVLTVQFGEPHGTYVINRQTPNLQIWLSSPTSGPKRYDFIDGHWVYKHDGVSLHDLLDEEISKIVRHGVDFKRCSYSIAVKEE